MMYAQPNVNMKAGPLEILFGSEQLVCAPPNVNIALILHLCPSIQHSQPFDINTQIHRKIIYVITFSLLI